MPRYPKPGASIEQIRETVRSVIDTKVVDIKDIIDMSKIGELLEDTNDETLDKIAQLEAILVLLNKEAMIIKGKLLEVEKILKEEDRDFKQDIIKTVGETPLGIGQTTKFFGEIIKLFRKYPDEMKKIFGVQDILEYFKRNVKQIDTTDMKLLPPKL
jgi:restriction endonuclease S subunit